MKVNAVKKKKKWIITGIVILAVGAVVASQVFGNKEPEGLFVSTAALERSDVRQVVSIKGTVEGSETADIASSEEKEVTAILVQEGDIVSKGQVLARLKPDSEDSQTQWGYDKQKAREDLELAKYEYEVNKELYEAGGLSKQEFLKYESTYKSSQINMNALNAKTFTEHPNEIVSPISGTVTRVNATLGLKANDTQNKGALFVVENLSNLEMNIRVSEYDIGKIEIGQPVEISAEVLGDKTVSGVVSHISPTGELKESNSKEMVIPVRISITESDPKLIAGVTAKAEILVGEVKDTLSLPLDAVATDPESGEHFVFTVQDGIAKKAAVTMGMESDFFAELKDGKLAEGDILILNPPSGLADGTPVITENGAGASDPAGAAAGGEAEVE